MESLSVRFTAIVTVHLFKVSLIDCMSADDLVAGHLCTCVCLFTWDLAQKMKTSATMRNSSSASGLGSFSHFALNTHTVNYNLVDKYTLYSSLKVDTHHHTFTGLK